MQTIPPLLTFMISPIYISIPITRPKSQNTTSPSSFWTRPCWKARQNRCRSSKTRRGCPSLRTTHSASNLPVMASPKTAPTGSAKKPKVSSTITARTNQTTHAASPRRLASVISFHREVCSTILRKAAHVSEIQAAPSSSRKMARFRSSASSLTGMQPAPPMPSRPPCPTSPPGLKKRSIRRRMTALPQIFTFFVITSRDDRSYL